VDAECDTVFPREFPAVVRVHLRDGRLLEERVMHNRGGPAQPLSDAEVQHKFALNAGLALAPLAITRVAESVFGLAQMDSVASLLEATAP
jgi:2-methylcitrate dehydratase PrpD